MANIHIYDLAEMLSCDFEEKPHFGYVYAIELEHGVKVGQTARIKQRMRQHQNTFETYGGRRILRIAVSPIHTNFRQNETDLLYALRLFRGGDTEMISAHFETVINEMKKLLFSSDFCAKSLDGADKMLQDTFEDIWGLSERSAKTILDCSDGIDDIQIKVGRCAWWLRVNGELISSNRDAILSFIVWYALHREEWDIIDYLDDMGSNEGGYSLIAEPVTKWMMDAITPYCEKVIIDAVWPLIREKLSEYESKYELYISAMARIAREKGYEYSVPPRPSFEQVVNEDYSGIEPLKPEPWIKFE